VAIGRVTKSDLLRLLLDLPQNRPRTSRECRETALYDEEMVEIVIPPNLLANLNLQCRIGILRTRLVQGARQILGGFCGWCVPFEHWPI